MSQPSNYYYFFEQLTKLIIGVVLWVIVYYIPLRIIKKWKYVIFFGSLFLVFLLFTWLWKDFEKWATLWLQIGWTTIQPGEFFKIWFVMFLSSRLLRKKKILDELQYYIGFLIMVALTCLVFLLLPDGWTLLLLWSVAMILFWYAWGKPYYIVITLILWCIMTVLAATQFWYIQRRLDFFFNPEVDVSGEWIARQTRQALVAVWWWWRVWKWYGKWLQKFWYIPEAQSDFIFAAFAEEVWFVGSALLLVLYFWLARIVLQRLPLVKDEYERLFAVGILSLIMMQAFINIWVNIKLLPLTWLTLPFISHGWSALLVNVVQIVLLYKIIRTQNLT